MEEGNFTLRSMGLLSFFGCEIMGERMYKDRRLIKRLWLFGIGCEWDEGEARRRSFAVRPCPAGT